MISLKPFVTCVVTLIVFVQSYCSAQDKSKVQYGKVSKDDFAPIPSNLVDSSTGAIILADIGSVHFVGNNKGWFSYVYARRTRVKILDKKALELATVELTLFRRDEDAEKADNILASTYNLENGVITETKLDKNDVYELKLDKYHTGKKFTLPAVKAGSIIEYTYTITSDFYFSLPSWEFQSINYPCLWSEFEVNIPQTLFYVFVRQGVHGYAVDKGSESREGFKLTDKAEGGLVMPDKDMFFNIMTVKHRWVIKDVPAFRSENYLSTPYNYIDKLDFQLEKIYNGQDTKEVKNTWKNATEDLLKQENFGQPLREDNEWLDAFLGKMPGQNTSGLDGAKAVYYYLSNHFTCTSYYDKYIRTTLQDVVKKNSGTVGDLNLLLIAILRRRGYSADPVLLSTREHGYSLVKYPIMDKLNYVIARLKTDGKIYYLDIARPQLGFGQLAGYCYNGHARIISEKDSGAVYFETDSLKEQQSTMVFISSGEKGMEGSFRSTLGAQESYNTRVSVGEIGETAYFKRIQTSYGDDLEIDHTGIDSLKRLEDPLTIRYDFMLKQSPGASIIYFNPMLGDAWHENPFKAAERKYPVEMPYVMDQLYVMNLDIPEGYVVEELPKSARVALNEDQGSFEYIIGKQDHLIQLRCRVRLNRANFAADDYPALRDFFGYIVKKENEPIVLKKQP